MREKSRLLMVKLRQQWHHVQNVLVMLVWVVPSFHGTLCRPMMMFPKEIKKNADEPIVFSSFPILKAGEFLDFLLVESLFGRENSVCNSEEKAYYFTVPFFILLIKGPCTRNIFLKVNLQSLIESLCLNLFFWLTERKRQKNKGLSFCKWQQMVDEIANNSWQNKLLLIFHSIIHHKKSSVPLYISLKHQM